MGSNNYGYYYTQNSGSYPLDLNQQWNEWSASQNYSRSNNTPYHQGTSLSNHNSHINNHNHNTPRLPPPPPPPAVYHNSVQNNTRHFHLPRRYNSNIPPPNWQQRNPGNYKRQRLDSTDSSEPKTKTTKKKKKPLSQNVPSKKNWSVEDAEKALAVEKEYNKRFKNHSLIIKFPDLELNKDIVSKFHPAIENVHFQQPSTPRFCFVTLQETADPDAVINTLNKQKFGDGYLTAEYKKDREDDQNIGPEDIDPLTLYVGNLAQEITKEDMITTYPKGRRIDIGYAKKMKYTRYAFVSFKTVSDSIEAFKNTHSTQMHSKSLIVRFRRLHGTVGMPGESKPQNPPKTRTEDGTTNDCDISSNQDFSLNTNNTMHISNNDSIDDSILNSSQVDLSVVKKEPHYSDDEIEQKIDIKKEFVTPFLSGSADQIFALHKPKVKVEIKEEIKTESEEKKDSNEDPVPVKSQEKSDCNVRIKTEPPDECNGDDFRETDEDSDEELISSSVTNFQKLFHNMVTHSNKISALKKVNQ